MMYWIVFALWIAAELVFDFFVSWLPFYYFAKTAFVIYLSHFRVRNNTPLPPTSPLLSLPPALFYFPFFSLLFFF